MSTDERLFLKELKKWLVVTFLGIIGLSVGFYFTTLNRLSNLESGQQYLESSKAEKDVIEIELKNINKSIDRIEGKLDKMKTD